ncbi:MAG: hypothetical protein U0835_15430 [Isosphaeraceae bacterium]
MKRTFAAVVLLTALGVLFKLALKQPGHLAVGHDRPAASSTAAADGAGAGPEVDPLEALRLKYPGAKDRALVERTYENYRQTALAVERTDGLRGLTLLDKLDIEAVFLYEKYPNDFRRLRDTLTDDAAADLLLHWREYFGLKRADDLDRGLLIAEIARLSPAQRRVAAKYPAALPLVLADPAGVTELVERWTEDPKDLNDLLVLLDFISLEKGTSDLRSALRTVDHHGSLALRAFRIEGMDGFALVSLYGPVIEAMGSALPLDQALILLRVNGGYVDEMLHTHRPETVASHLRHVAGSGLVDAVGGSPNALRLVVEHGTRGEQALRHAGPDAADVVYEDFAEPTLRNQAVDALAEHGAMALAMLDKYAQDPDFRDILRTHGAAVIPPVARTDAGPETLSRLGAKAKWTLSERIAHSVLYVTGENGQATIRTIKNDGLERVAALNETEVSFSQFLPLYDLAHLGNVLRNGHAPTTGEMTWALIDGCFVVADALSLAALQPEGVAASEATRAEVKAATREAVKALGREAVEEATETAARSAARQGATAAVEQAAERATRWWAVRAAGGTYRVLRRLPEALPRLTLPELSALVALLYARAGLRLSEWTPVRLLKNGQEFVLRIPPEKGLKYVGLQFAQASVGVVGFRKMEEHLASRRPQKLAD